jgi:ParB family transcriptional regulator, chromosome partitioning protein
MTNPSAVRNIPLDKLVLSPGNVRKTPPSPAEEAELKASIKARGLKQNLVVHPATDEKGVDAVTAGGRRLKALQELAAEGVIADDFKVPCLVEEPEAALETSLIENTIRAAMHPADEFVAMASLIDAGEVIEAIAVRFGTSERHVRQRLRLGKLVPELLDAYRAGRDRARGGDRLHPRRRSRGAARRVASGQGQFLHPALHGAASADRDRRSARLPTWQLRRRRGL